MKCYEKELNMEDMFLDCIKKYFSQKGYYINHIDNGKLILVVFSQKNYTKEEQKALFDNYKNNKCLDGFNPAEQPHSRYLYVEEIIDNKYFDNREGVLTFVMLNPSYANECKSDKTMDRVRSWATKVEKKDSKNKGYKYFAVINLFAYRHHKPSVLKEINASKESLFKDDYLKNNTFIDKYLKFCENVNDFVVAFGVSKDFNDEKEEMIEKLKNKNLLTFYSDKKSHHLLCRKKVYNEKHELNLYDLVMTNE